MVSANSSVSLLAPPDTATSNQAPMRVPSHASRSQKPPRSAVVVK
jgi:hypothetical protein